MQIATVEQSNKLSLGPWPEYLIEGIFNFARSCVHGNKKMKEYDLELKLLLRRWQQQQLYTEHAVWLTTSAECHLFSNFFDSTYKSSSIV